MSRFVDLTLKLKKRILNSLQVNFTWFIASPKEFISCPCSRFRPLLPESGYFAESFRWPADQHLCNNGSANLAVWDYFVIGCDISSMHNVQPRPFFTLQNWLLTASRRANQGDSISPTQLSWSLYRKESCWLQQEGGKMTRCKILFSSRVMGKIWAT